MEKIDFQHLLRLKALVNENVDKLVKSQNKKEIDAIYNDLDTAIWLIYQARVTDIIKRG